MTFKRVIEFHIPCDDQSRWSISFTRNGAEVFIGLHFGDKVLATYGVDVSVDAFRQMTTELLQDP